MKDINSMSLEEKILQTKVALMQRGEKFNEKVGAAFFFGQIITEADDAGLDELRGYVKDAVENSDIPPLITSDFENGCGSMVQGLTPLPYLMGLGAANDEGLAYDYGRATALEARTVGANWSFSPVSDLNMNRRNPLVNVRSIGDNTDLACRLLKQVVSGMQDGGIAACAKHFPGDGMDYRDQHIVTTQNSLSVEEWKEKSGRVFKELIDSGVDSIMAGHISFPSYQSERDAESGLPYPATLSYELIAKLLKNEMGFKGVVVTDALGMGGIQGFYDTKERTEIEAFKAGCDMVLWSTESYVENMKKAVESGYISIERLNDAVQRIMNLKEKLGLFDKNRKVFYELTDEEKSFVRKTQKAVSKKSITLIRNKKGLLPTDPKSVKKVLLVPVIDYKPVFSVAEHLRGEIEKRGVKVFYMPEADSQKFDAYANEADLIIFAMFSRPFRPIGFLDYYGDAAQLLTMAASVGREKTVGVSFGSPYFCNQYFEKTGTFVNAYSMLDCSAEAFAEAMFGEEDFGCFSPVEL